MLPVSRVLGINLPVDCLADLRPVLEALGLTRYPTDYPEAELWEHKRLRSGLLHLFERPTFEPGHVELVIEGVDVDSALEDADEKRLLDGSAEVYLPSDQERSIERLQGAGVVVHPYSPTFWPVAIVLGRSPGGLEFELFYSASGESVDPPRLEAVAAASPTADRDRSFWHQLGLDSGRAMSGQEIRVDDGDKPAWGAEITLSCLNRSSALKQLSAGAVVPAAGERPIVMGGLRLAIVEASAAA